MSLAPSSSGAAFERLLLPDERAVLERVGAELEIDAHWTELPSVRIPWETLAVERLTRAHVAAGMGQTEARRLACDELAVPYGTHRSRLYDVQSVIPRRP